MGGLSVDEIGGLCSWLIVVTPMGSIVRGGLAIVCVFLIAPNDAVEDEETWVKDATAMAR